MATKTRIIVNPAMHPLAQFIPTAIASVKEIMKVVKTEAQSSLQGQLSGNSSGMLMGSFGEEPVVQSGIMRIKGVVFAGGPSAPYAPIVEHIGWGKTNKKSPYYFMKAGAEKGGEATEEIVLKNFNKFIRGR